jgi:hypothetical protein
MKKSYTVMATGIVMLSYQGLVAQGTFENLDFESATLSPSGGAQYVSIVSALPDWTGFLGTTLQTQVYQNGTTTGGASIDIFGPNYAAAGSQMYYDPGIIDGDFTAMLQAGFGPSNTTSGVNASISQNGTVPANAQSIQWKAWSVNSSELTVSFDGNNLSPTVIGSGPNYTLFGANISAFAGQSGNLDFTSVFNNSTISWIELDDITFSTTAVPEPTTLALMVMGGVAFGARLWHKRGS